MEPVKPQFVHRRQLRPLRQAGILLGRDVHDAQPVHAFRVAAGQPHRQLAPHAVPEQGGPRQTLRVGETGLAFFTVTNRSDQALTGRASYNVSPDQAGAYMRKLQCFCFNDQTIPAHTTVKFPVLYFIDPGFASDPDTKGFTDIVLSYTFFPAPKPTQPLGGSGQARL